MILGQDCRIGMPSQNFLSFRTFEIYEGSSFEFLFISHFSISYQRKLFSKPIENSFLPSVQHTSREPIVSPFLRWKFRKSENLTWKQCSLFVSSHQRRGIHDRAFQNGKHSQFQESIGEELAKSSRNCSDRFDDREVGERKARLAELASGLIYLLYLPDQQLLHIKPTFPPIFFAITRCAVMRGSSLPVVSLDNVLDVLSRVMSTPASADEVFCLLHARESSLFHRRVSSFNKYPRTKGNCLTLASMQTARPDDYSFSRATSVLKNSQESRTADPRAGSGDFARAFNRPAD